MVKYIYILLIVGVFTACKKNECKDTTCYNEGVCVDGTCQCPPGVYGTHCEDTCISKKCENESTKTDCNCECLPMFYGTNCQDFLLRKSYVVKNMYIIDDEQFRNGPPKVSNKDILTTTIVALKTGDYLIGKKTLIHFTNPDPRVALYFFIVSHTEMGNYINMNSGVGYSDYFNATVFNYGDSIHVVHSRSGKSPFFSRRDIFTYDLVATDTASAHQ